MEIAIGKTMALSSFEKLLIHSRFPGPDAF